MLRLTTLNKSANPTMAAIIQQILPVNSISPQKTIRDIWDFGDSLIIGNKTTNMIKSWEVVDRYCVTLDNDEIYVDLLADGGGIGHGPCERQTQEVSRITAADYIIDRTAHTTELCIPVVSPYDIDSNNIVEFIKTGDMRTSWLKINALPSTGREGRKEYTKRVPVDRQRGGVGATIPLIVRANSSQKISKRK